MRRNAAVLPRTAKPMTAMPCVRTAALSTDRTPSGESPVISEKISRKSRLSSWRSRHFPSTVASKRRPNVWHSISETLLSQSLAAARYPYSTTCDLVGKYCTAVSRPTPARLAIDRMVVEANPSLRKSSAPDSKSRCLSATPGAGLSSASSRFGCSLIPSTIASKTRRVENVIRRLHKESGPFDCGSLPVIRGEAFR